MTALPAERAPRRVRSYEPGQPDWAKVGVIVGILVQCAAAIWFASAMDRRVTALEQQMPPGVIQRLDERTLQIQATLGRLEARS